VLFLKPVRSLLILVSLIIVSLFAGGVAPARAFDFQPHAPIVIDGNSGFTQENGVTGGSGTVSDPYDIEGWNIGLFPGIEIRNTDAHFVIRDVRTNIGVVLSNVTNGRVSSGVFDNRLECPRGCPHGILVIKIDHSSSLSFTENAIFGNGDDEGISLADSSSVEIKGNRFAGAGVLIDTSSAVEVKQNWFAFAQLVVESSRAIEVSNNDMKGYVAGVSILGSFNVTISWNNVNDGLGIVFSGCKDPCLQYLPSSRVNIQGNNISNGSLGIDFGSPVLTSFVTVTDNYVYNNSFGIVAFDGEGNAVYHNNIVNNGVTGSPFYLQAIGSEDVWDNGYPGGGNFWSDYSGKDKCSGPRQEVCPSPDGIGDRPYMLTSAAFGSHVKDRYPLMKPFAPSVAGSVRLEPGSITPQDDVENLTAFVRLPKGYNASNLILSSIRLNGTIAAVVDSTLGEQQGHQHGQQREHGAAVFVVKFNMTQVRVLMPKPGTYTLRISGNLLTNTNFRPFEAAASVRLI